METLTNLLNLHLNDNEIIEIKGLKTLTKLRKFHLNDNKIAEIKGLENLANLQNLELYGNQIPKDKLIKFDGSWIKTVKYCQKKEKERIVEEKEEQKRLEGERKEQLEAEKREIEEKARLEMAQLDKLKKLVKVSKSVKIEMMRKILRMDEDMFNDKVIDWAMEFGFEIDREYININKDTVDDFIRMLDDQFEAWGEIEQGKMGKID